MAQLFKKNILKEKLETFQILDLEWKIQILESWNNLYKEGKLHEKKETSIQWEFASHILGSVLWYDDFVENNQEWNRQNEPWSPTGGQSADYGLWYFKSSKDFTKNKVNAVVEVKDTKTSLDKPQKREWNLTPVQQAFKYKPFFKECDFIVVSNFYETRLYIDSYYDYESFTLSDLVNPKDNYFNFRKFYYLLSKQNLLSKRWDSNTKSLLSLIRTKEKEITKQFYKEYTQLRKELFKDIVANNSVKKTELDFILWKTQKIIDRIIFIHFCEDLDLLPNGKLKQNILRAEEIGFTPWEMLTKFFEFVNSWSEKLGIPDGYNGWLFHADEKLNNLKVWNEICKKFVDMWDYDFADDLSVNILGHIFEQSISDIEELKDKINKEEEVTLSKRKKDWVFYTPEYIVDYIVKNSVGKKIDEWEDDLKQKHNLKEDITDKNYEKRAILVYSELQEKVQKITVLDPACGSGAFLVKVFDFLLDKNKEISKKLEDLWVNQGFMALESHFKSILQNNIYWVDLNDESVEITKLSLWLKTAQKGKKLANLDENIKCGNSLIDDPEVAGDKAFVWEIEFKEIFADWGFDVIVGNPPYLRVQWLQAYHQESVKFYEDNYDSSTWRFDIYVLFIEKCNKILKNNWKLGFILPHKFINSDFWVWIRKSLSENKSVEEIISFWQNLIFENVSTYTCLLFINNSKKEHLKYIEFEDLKDDSSQIFEKLFSLNNDDYSEINYFKLSEKSWSLTDKNTSEILDKIDNLPLKVSDVFEKISQWIVTVWDDIFLMKWNIINEEFIGFSEKLWKTVILESSIVKPLLRGENSKKYSHLSNTDYCLYPHVEKDGKTIPLEEEKFKEKYPLAYNYILPYKEELIAKKIRYKTNPKAWYSLHRSREISLFHDERIITPEISLGNNMTIDSDNYFHNTQIYSFIKKDENMEDNKFWLTIMNSSIFWFFLKNTWTTLRWGYFRFMSKYLLPFWLPKLNNLEEQTPFIEKADFMLENNKILQDKINKFLKRLNGSFEIEKLSKKLEAFYDLEFADFVKELKKKKVVLSLKDQDEWEEYFDSYKKEVLELKGKINSCDKEIDEMVFDLYGLNEEEREVVLGS